MQFQMSNEHPKYVCGKCGSTALYRDDDYIASQAYICCKICGNRWPGGFEPRAVAPANRATPERETGDFDPVPPRIQTDIDRPSNTIDKLNQLLIKQEATMAQTTGQAQPDKKRRGAQKTAPCANCERKLPIQGKGLCGGCRAVTKTTPPEKLEAALAAAKLRFSDPNFGDKRHHGQRSPNPPADGYLTDQSKQSNPIPDPDPNINLVFPSHDQPLYDSILAEAKRYRRDPGQQILWIVGEALKCGGLE